MSPSTSYERTVTIPPLTQWRCELWRPASESLASLRSGARISLLRIAADYQRFLWTVAEKQGFSPSAAVTETGVDASIPMVMTGHQPVIFHAGLTWKYEATEQFVRSRELHGIAVLIDTDEGDAGAFEIPVAEGRTLPTAVLRRRTERVSLSRQPGLYLTSQLASRAELATVFARVERALLESGLPEVARRVADAGSRYAAFGDSSAVVANTVMRQVAGIGRGLLEVPFSRLCRLPEMLRFFSQLLERAREFHGCYNEVLDRYRQEHGIRNEANPFPNLRLDQDGFEMPFWLVEPAAGTRSTVWLQASSGGHWLCRGRQPLTELGSGFVAESLLGLLAQGWTLVPRGALITASLRLLFSDLFVHGLGGGRYDAATDQLIRAWWHEEPAPFAVASASKCLFPEDRDRLHRLQQFQTQIREMQYNPGRFLGQGVFPEDLESRLKVLLADKDAAVAMLKSCRETGVSGRDIGRRIQQLTEDIRGLVMQSVQPQMEALQEWTPETISTVESRLWPWFFYPDEVGVSAAGEQPADSGLPTV